MSDRFREELLDLARSGDVESLGRILEQHRSFLRREAQRQLGQRLTTRVDQSDVVQETFLEAHRDFAGFRGSSEAELVGWLSRILDNNIAEAVRRHEQVQKRSVRVEQRMDDSAVNAADRVRAAVDPPTPGQQAVREEERAQLDQALEELTVEERQATRLRYIEGCSLPEVADQLCCSENEVVSLLKRSVRALKRVLPNDPSSPG